MTQQNPNYGLCYDKYYNYVMTFVEELDTTCLFWLLRRLVCLQWKCGGLVMIAGLNHVKLYLSV